MVGDYRDFRSLCPAYMGRLFFQYLREFAVGMVLAQYCFSVRTLPIEPEIKHPVLVGAVSLPLFVLLALKGDKWTVINDFFRCRL